MASNIRCGRCGRSILAGDAFQCTSCSTCFHASCWISNPSCTCGCATNRVVHLTPSGEIIAQASSNRSSRPPSERYGASYSTPSGRSRAASRRTPMKRQPENVELECSHCLLPVDTLDEPCPFCGHNPSGRNNQLVIQDNRDLVTYDDAPWGIRALSAINQATAVFLWFMAMGMLFPTIIEGAAGGLLASAICTGFGYFNWRLGTDLLKKRAWARNMHTLFGVFSLFGFPFGTFTGALTLWAIHSEAAEEYFNDKPLLPENTD